VEEQDERTGGLRGVGLFVERLVVRVEGQRQDELEQTVGRRYNAP